MIKYYKKLIDSSYHFDFPIHKPYFELNEEQKKLLWNGNSYFTGIFSFFKKIEKNNYKIQNRVLLSRYRGKTKCNECYGSRLSNASKNVKINDRSICDLLQISLDDLDDFIENLKLSSNEKKISERLLIEIKNRLKFIKNVGLGYLTLNRRSDTLSGGESQRIQLVTSLGSSLVGSMYILDEPSIGLHPRDNENLIKVLKDLRDLGNTVIVVEHDEEIMNAADNIIDIGPKAGSDGGKVIASGSIKKILTSNGLTAEYLNGDRKIELPEKRRSLKNFIEIIGARENNLKNINVKILFSLTVICGVSGSGKST